MFDIEAGDFVPIDVGNLDNYSSLAISPTKSEASSITLLT